MKTIHSDFKKGEVKVKITQKEDLWYLKNILREGDIIKGKTYRKIDTGKKEGRSKKERKKVYLEIKLENTETNESEVLRAKGKVSKGTEEVSKGTYHTFNIKPGTIITIQKNEWLIHEKEQLKESKKTNKAKILICVHDRQEATIASSTGSGYKILTTIKGDAEKKEERATNKGNFYEELIKILKEYNKRIKPKTIILASPAFYKDDLYDKVQEQELKEKTIKASCSSSKPNAIEEVLKRPETKTALKEIRASKESKLIDKLMKEISKQRKAAYGLEEVKKTAKMGAIKHLLVTEKTIKKYRKKDKYKTLNQIMKQVKNTRGEITIISSEHSYGEKLEGLGGIAAILRYKP